MAEDNQRVEDANNMEEGEVSPAKEIEPDFSRKHPLEHRWTLWFDNPSGKQTLSKFGQGLRAVYSFDSVEDFWW
jgi:translation initiation factor 4E